MSSYYDDNYGWYDVSCEEDKDFYFQTQYESVEKQCSRCDRIVSLRREYSICNSCADKIERGWDF